jgi:hypothetical protein
MPQDGAPRRRSGSLFVPILLIAFGVFFLYYERHPEFDAWSILWTYWPLILIFLGLGKMWDYMQRRQNPDRPPSSGMGGTVAAIVLVFVFLALMAGGRHFGRWNRRYGTVYAMQHLSQNVDRQDAKTVDAHISMGAGDLSLSGGSSHLFEGDFSYRSSDGAPRVEYSVSGTTGELRVSQDEAGTHFGRSGDNHWTMHLANDVPIDLRIDMGAGRGDLRLRDINVTRLTMNIGAGQVDVDVTGDRKSDLTATIEGGVGRANVRLPKNIGVIVNASGGLGTIDTHGLKHDGNDYVNDAYGKSPVTIHLRVEGGVGTITLTEE